MSHPSVAATTGRRLPGLLARLAVVCSLMLGLAFVDAAPAQAATDAQVAEVQRRLRTLGIYVAVDGVEGPRTRQGLCAARRLLGYRAAGRQPIASSDVDALRRANGLPRPKNGTDYLFVDRQCQMLYQAKGGRWIRLTPVSTGAAGHTTPGGSYRITWRWAGWHDSSKYPSGTGAGNMYNSLYFRSGGYAIHGSHSVPAYPASHGCIRVRVGVANKLWRTVPNGTPLYIY